jgi:hypothetical protein
MFAVTNMNVKKFLSGILFFLVCGGLFGASPSWAGQAILVTGSGTTLGCLTAGTTEFSIIVNAKCSDKSPAWGYNPQNKTIELNSAPGNLCLAADVGAVIFGAYPENIMLESCAGYSFQVQWDWTAAGELRNIATGTCLKNNPQVPNSLALGQCDGTNFYQFPAGRIGYWRTDYSDLNTGAYQGSDYHCLRGDGTITNIYNYFGFWNVYANGNKLTLRAKNANDNRVFTSVLKIDSATSYVGVHQNEYFPTLGYKVELAAKFSLISGVCP